MQLDLRTSCQRMVAVLALFVCSACSGPGARLNPVEGQVLFKDKPAAGVVVTFHPSVDADSLKTVRPVAMTGEDGKFKLMTGPDNGARAGGYTVTFIWPQEVSPKGKGGSLGERPESVDRLKGAYVNAATSSFKAQIKDGANQLEPFVLK